MEKEFEREVDNKIEGYCGGEGENGMNDECDENQNNNSKYHKIKGRDKSVFLVNKVESMEKNSTKNLADVKEVINKTTCSIKHRVASEKQLNIIFFNARSIKNKMDEFKILMC